MTPVRLEPAASLSQVKHSTTEPLRSKRDPDQTQHYGVSDLGLHYLPISHKKDTRLILVNPVPGGLLYAEYYIKGVSYLQNQSIVFKICFFSIYV